MLEKCREVSLSVEDLRAFESEVIQKFENAEIPGPVHLSYGNENALREIFQYVHSQDWVFSTWRNHYHALLHGIPRTWLLREVIEGRSMNISNAEHRFHTSAIVGGIIPIALGTAFALKRKESPRTVWCFIGDMAYLSGICYEAYRYASVNNLPLRFVVEDNGYSTNTPTLTSWGLEEVSSIFPYQKLESVNMLNDRCWYYRYERKYPHVGIGKYVSMT